MAGKDPRVRMIAEIERDAQETAASTGRAELNPMVLAALRSVGRQAFVPGASEQAAWLNRPLPIGHGQTISQPFIVALMTDLLDIEPGQTVLEIGTGSGYQAAILAALGARVFSLEIIPALALTARAALDAAGRGDVQIRVGDGATGWPEEAPFDRVIVTAAAPEIPQALIAQLRAGGRMIIPLGEPGGHQVLELVVKQPSGEVRRRTILPVAFVPLTGTQQGARQGFPQSGRPA